MNCLTFGMVGILASAALPQLPRGGYRHLHVFEHGTGNAFGYLTKALGDLDGDGRQELAISAPGQDIGSATRVGRVRIYNGCLETPRFEWDGTATEDVYGVGLDSAGDIDRDGVMDILVGASEGAGQRGRIEIRSGKTGSILRIYRGEAAGDRIGGVVHNVGDLDGDRFVDHLVGGLAPLQGRGAGYLYSGRTGALIRKHTGDVKDEYFCRSGSGLGDVDGDGVPDYAIGSLYDSSPTVALCGSVTVFSGRNGRVIHTLFGSQRNGAFGLRVATAGDADADGRPDLLVGENGVGVGSPGAIHLYSGRTGALLRTAPSVAGLKAGYGTGGLGDIDGDGHSDYAVGYDDISTRTLPGQMRVFSGRTGAELWRHVSKGQYANAIAGIGDWNEDGHRDIAVTDAVFQGGKFTGQVVLLSSTALSLVTNVCRVSMASGGEQRLFLNAGPAHAGRFFYFLGSMSGTNRGVHLAGLTVPLNPDGYFLWTLLAPSFVLYDAGLRLDVQGRATARIRLPRMRFFPATRSDHAFVAFDGRGLHMASNAAVLEWEK